MITSYSSYKGGFHFDRTDLKTEKNTEYIYLRVLPVNAPTLCVCEVVFGFQTPFFFFKTLEDLVGIANDPISRENFSLLIHFHVCAFNHDRCVQGAGPDWVPNWLLREYAEVLVEPVTAILNSSYKEQKLPSPWKLADVVPLPKQKPVEDLSKHLRPISLTPSSRNSRKTSL